MSWTLVVTPSAQRQLERLDVDLRARVAGKLENAMADPPRFFRRLKGRVGWRVRIGEWRALALLDASSQTVTLFRVAHRRNVYD